MFAAWGRDFLCEHEFREITGFFDLYMTSERNILSVQIQDGEYK
jgi:hypothetical protein